jgi:hypothetical protein
MRRRPDPRHGRGLFRLDGPSVVSVRRSDRDRLGRRCAACYRRSVGESVVAGVGIRGARVDSTGRPARALIFGGGICSFAITGWAFLDVFGM